MYGLHLTELTVLFLFQFSFTHLQEGDRSTQVQLWFILEDQTSTELLDGIIVIMKFHFDTTFDP